MTTAHPAWTQLTTELKELKTLGGVSAVIAWDQQTMMPPGAAALRGDQMALMSRILHEKFVSQKIGDLLHSLEEEQEALTATQRVAIQRVRADYDRSTRVPSELVEQIGHAQAKGFQSWHAAKEAKSFEQFAPVLEELVDLAKARALAIDPDTHPHQTMVDQFDPGAKVDELQQMFSRLQTGLTELIDATRDAEPRPRITEHFDPKTQLALHNELLQTLGYDLQTGRLDEAAHPFTISLGHPTDVRVTTHIEATDLLSGLGGTIHEAGHGMYEQGLPTELVGTGLAEAASLGLHESQSRFWENFIGRSEAFFNWFSPRLKTHFPSSQVSAADLYRAANRIQPSLIRISADEVTYNLHIIIRFELEHALFSGDLAVADLRDAWNERYQRYLGITPGHDAEGVLQDVHWSGLSFGYFQSYTLGNLYAASFGHALEQSHPTLWSEVEAGDFSGVLNWLRTHIHAHGRTYDAPDLVQQVVGRRDHVADLLDYLWGRHGKLYGLTAPH